MSVFETHSDEETIAVGRRIAATLPRRAVVLLIGNLGAGKTTLAKGIVSGLCGVDSDEVVSPTFTLIHEYGRKVTLKADEEQIRSQLAERFQSLGLQVPTPDELIDSLKLDRNTARKIVQLLLKENVLVKINDEIVVHRVDANSPV